jgi:hypothetical protein
MKTHQELGTVTKKGRFEITRNIPYIDLNSNVPAVQVTKKGRFKITRNIPDLALNSNVPSIQVTKKGRFTVMKDSNASAIKPSVRNSKASAIKPSVRNSTPTEVTRKGRFTVTRVTPNRTKNGSTEKDKRVVELICQLKKALDAFRSVQCQSS